MKKHIPTIFFTPLIALPSLTNAATVVFTEDFIGATVASSEFGNQTLGDPNVPSTSIFNGGNGFTVDGAAGTVAIDIAGNSRSSTFFVNLSGFTAGTYNINFDFDNFMFRSDRADAALFTSLSLVEGLGVTAADTITFDLNDNAGMFQPDTNSIGLAPSAGSNATVTSLGNDIIFAQGVQPAPAATVSAATTGTFTLANDADANSLLAVSFVRDPGTGGGAQNSFFTIDTVTIEAIPEPSSLFLLGLSGIFGFARRRK